MTELGLQEGLLQNSLQLARRVVALRRGPDGGSELRQR